MLNCALGGEPAGFYNVISLTYWLAQTICWYPLRNYKTDFVKIFQSWTLIYSNGSLLAWNMNKISTEFLHEDKTIIEQRLFLNFTFLTRLFRIPLNEKTWMMNIWLLLCEVSGIIRHWNLAQGHDRYRYDIVGMRVL